MVVWLIATTIATRELIRSGQVVIASVRMGDLGCREDAGSMIVGRDTKDLYEKGY